MNREEVFAAVRAQLADVLEIDQARIAEHTSFKEDLAADSLHLVELAMELEDSYGIKITDEDARNLPTVGAVVDFVASRLAPA